MDVFEAGMFMFGALNGGRKEKKRWEVTSFSSGQRK